jgi:hypothetical protein
MPFGVTQVSAYNEPTGPQAFMPTQSFDKLPPPNKRTGTNTIRRANLGKEGGSSFFSRLFRKTRKSKSKSRKSKKSKGKKKSPTRRY